MTLVVTAVEYEGDGSTVDFDFPFTYLDSSFVKVSLDGTPTEAFTLLDANTVRMTVAPSSGVTVRVYRETSSTALVVWEDDAIILGTDLETARQQPQNLAEEARFLASEAAADAAAAVTDSAADAAAAAASASAAATSASAAATSASAAATSATNASNSASTASGHATTALNHANTASGHASAASGHASTALGHANTASGHANTASGHADTASGHASTASGHADTAGGHATAAGASASAASGSASSASASASTATTKANEAAASATDALNHANAASASAASAASSATSAITALDNFDDRYLGQKSSDPTVDNDGNALLVGALYFNTTINKMKTWTGSSWAITFSDSSAASSITNDSAVSGATVKDALETLNTGKQSTNASLTTIINGAASNDGKFLAGVSGSLQYTRSLAAGTLTANDPHSLSMTFNNAAVTFTAHSIAITDTASASASMIFDHTVGGTRRLGLRKDGALFIGSSGGFISDGSGGTIHVNNGVFNFGNSNFQLVGRGLSAGVSLGSQDVILTRSAAAAWQLGAANAAAPIAQTLRTQGSRSGTDTNTGGGNLTIQSGQGTGTGTISKIVLQTPVAAASGTGAQTLTTGLEVINGTAKLTSYGKASLPSASASGAGAMIYVTDDVDGAVPAFSDGSNWLRVTDRAVIS